MPPKQPNLGGKRPRGGALGKKPKTPSERQEDRVAEITGGQRMPGSGCHPANPDDVIDGDQWFRIECKGTGRASLALHRRQFVQITKHARERNQEPALQFSFEEIAPGTAKDWIAIPLQLFERMRQHCVGTGFET